MSDTSDLRWFDSHCHLGSDAAEVIARARAAGVVGIITVGTDLEESRAAIDTAHRFDDVWATAGVHPHEARFGMDGIVELLDDEVVVAVGEAGLDFHYEYSPRGVQSDVFAAQVALANERGMPLVVHSREAWEERPSLCSMPRGFLIGRCSTASRGVPTWGRHASSGGRSCRSRGS